DRTMEDKLTISALRQMKRDGRKIVGVVAWDTEIARIADRAGVDFISVGDSVGLNLWGHATDTEVTVEEMLIVCKAVRRGAKRALVSCDIPNGPAQTGTEAAVSAAVRFAKEGGADMAKALGDPSVGKAIVRGGVPVSAGSHGPPLLMYAPAGFDATLDKWKTQGVYARIKLLDHLPKRYTCIVFDRRETGQSGGRVERITWAHYVSQGKGLLEHLKFKRAHLMGGCMGCCPIVAFGVAHPEMVMSMVLYWPVGGARYRISTHKRFADHLAYVEEHGLAGVVSLVMQEGKAFNAEPRGGPWASVIKSDRAFADAYSKLDAGKYTQLVADMCRTLFDRDTSPGAEPEDLLRC